MAKSAMPVSKAKTAYGLLSEIRRLIVQEPRRYDQEDWLVIGSDVAEIYEENAPPCGTVGCVAGWVCTLKGVRPTGDGSEAFKAARILLGEEYFESVPAQELFRASAAGMRGHTLRTIALHAKRGAKHIAKFQKKYAKQLKAKRV